jgi:hypothetical protein
MSEYAIPIERFDDAQYIDRRLRAAPESGRASLSTALRYLYSSDGPINLPRPRLRIAEAYVEPRERILLRWLYTRTNGRLRSTYGAKSLIAARKSRYRCSQCGYADVRALHIDHVMGRIKNLECACLCANCHNIKSREKDWSGKRRY